MQGVQAAACVVGRRCSRARGRARLKQRDSRFFSRGTRGRASALTGPARAAGAGNRAMGLQANVSAPPATVVDADRGVVTDGAVTLSFFLAAPARAAGAQQAAGQGREPGAAREAGAGAAPRGPHLFTLEVAGELEAGRLALERDAPARPGSYRLSASMQLVLPALKARARCPPPLPARTSLGARQGGCPGAAVLRACGWRPLLRAAEPAAMQSTAAHCAWAQRMFTAPAEMAALKASASELGPRRGQRCLRQRQGGAGRWRLDLLHVGAPMHVPLLTFSSGRAGARAAQRRGQCGREPATAACLHRGLFGAGAAPYVHPD